MDSLIRLRLFLINRSCGFLCASKAECIRCKFSLGGISFHPNFIVVSFSGCEVSDRIIKIHRADTIHCASVQFLNCQNNPVSLFLFQQILELSQVTRALLIPDGDAYRITLYSVSERIALFEAP